VELAIEKFRINIKVWR